ncbi:MAG: CocE/NonD family hydrolase [bacterium]
MLKKSYAWTLTLLSLFYFCVSAYPTDVKDATCEVEVLAEVKVPMRDGVNLRANIFVPKMDGEFPVILMRTPYGKGDEEQSGSLHYASHGFVRVNQDCRGRGTSGGEWEPFLNEIPDGYDTLKWILEQPWCNGKIGTAGASYVGFTQWMLAPGSGEHLKAMFPGVPMVDPYQDLLGTHGAFPLGDVMGWGSDMSFRPGEENPLEDWTDDDWGKAYRLLPLCTWDVQAVGRKIQYLRDWMSHLYYDEYWKKRTIADRLDEITTPICVVGGWYDIFAKSALEHVGRVRTTSASKKARQHQHVVIGPWIHGGDEKGKVGDLDFGKKDEVRMWRVYWDLETRWFDYWLKGKETGVEDLPPYRIFVMGRNEWRDEQEWPLKRTRYTAFYIHSNGSANTLDGDGTLSKTKPTDTSPDKYVYDPEDPVPTSGGCVLAGAPAGPRDQREVEKREDVLVYTGEALKEEIEVTGPVKVVLYAASSAPDTDWTAKLVDVYPDGRAINLCDGIIRARCRESAENPILIEPERIYRYDIDLWVTSNVFLAGHRIRVEISSSNFPRFDRNPNTGHALGVDSEIRKAAQTVYHDSKHPSHIRLPIIPGR